MNGFPYLRLILQGEASVIYKYYQVERAFSYYGGKPSLTGKTGVNLLANEGRKSDTPVRRLLSRH